MTAYHTFKYALYMFQNPSENAAPESNAHTAQSGPSCTDLSAETSPITQT